MNANTCQTCAHWRRLNHWPHAGLCKRFSALKINDVESDGLMAMVPNPGPDNFGLPTDGVITGFAFGCIKHEPAQKDT